MPRSSLLPFAICTLVGVLPDGAVAQALPLKTNLKLGRPAQAVEVTIQEADTLQLSLKGVTLKVPARGVTSATAESFSVAENGAVALVRVTASNGQWAALLGGKAGQELVYTGRTDLVGDPGERHASIIETAGGPDATTAITVGTRFDGVAHCGSNAPLLVDEQVLDPKTLKLTSKHAGQPPATEPAALTATAIEGELAPTATQTLTASASNQKDVDTGTLQVPRALVDGALDTAWQAHPGASALLRWSSPTLAIERLTVQLAGRSAKDKPFNLLILGEGAAFRVSFPKAGGADRYEITLPTPLTTRCLEVALEHDPNIGSVQIAELRPGTMLDRPEGLGLLVSQLVQDGESGAAAAELLAQLGTPAAVATAARFEELSVRGQRRALRVLAGALPAPEVRARVLQAARSQDPHLRDAALTVLSRGKEAGLAGLRELALSADAAGDAAAHVLATAPSSEAPALLAALATEQGSERPALRRALIAIARRDASAFRTASEAWLASAPKAGPRIVFALVAVGAGLPELGTTVAEGALPDTSSFAERFRLSVLAAQLRPSAPLDAWLTNQATEADEWMVRRAAYDALAARGSASAQSLADQISKDPYPRVRAGAAPALAKAGKQGALEQAAKTDHWPLVRAAAASALGTLKSTRPALEALLDDTSRRVRSAAVDALATQGTSASWPLVERRLIAANEWPEVQAAAVRFAANLCVQDARGALTQTARRGLRPDANEDERQLGLEAIHALHDLGGAAAADAKLLATRESSSELLQQAIARFAPSRCTNKAP